MKNPVRRNKNIGTSKQGYSKDNKLVIAWPASVERYFYERLEKYQKIERIIKGHEFTFIIEETRKNCFHACTVDDLATLISCIPENDYGELRYIVLRQPKRKEETLSPVWGRLIYSYEFEDNHYPAVIIEAIDLSKSFKWEKKLSPDKQEELERLRNDGHPIIEGKRHFEADYALENVRNTQLYRTLPHEFGHYVHYLEFVERPSQADEEFEGWEQRHDRYWQLPVDEKEKFAHNYAYQLTEKLKSKYIIPFERMDNLERMQEQHILLSNFIAE